MSLKGVGFTVLLKSSIALFRGNVRCLFQKMFHPKSFRYHPYLRIYGGASVLQRDGGKIQFGKNLKVDPQALISVNGGELILGDGVGIGRNNIVASHEKITIGSGTLLGPNVFIYDHDHIYDSERGVLVTEYKNAEITIGKNCWIGANTVILKGTTIGDNCLVGAGSVIKGNFPAGSKIVQKRSTEIIGG